MSSHRVLVNANGTETKELELDNITLMFFDTLMAAFNSTFPVQRMPFDFFEYMDEDGDSITVRTDEELQAFLVELLRTEEKNPLKIRLKSSNSLMRQQISFDESDDFILPSMAPSTVGPSSSQQQENAQNEVGSNCNRMGPTTATISPDDLQLIERLSDGQFGTVYKALDVKNDRLVAVKCVAVDNTSGTRQALLNEIAIMRKCVHPNIVTFHAAFFIENQLLICMELMDALSMDLYGQLPPLALGAVSVAVVDGLAHLWGRSIMHRDIKPSNFLVNSAGQVKLGDFGVSKQMAQSIAWSYVGTKVYMAPERITGDVYNVASDIWSLGVALAEMALGRFPFKSDANSAVESLMFFLPERISELVNDPGLMEIGNGFGALIAGCLAPDPKMRNGPEEIFMHEFLQANRPMNQQFVAEFIDKRRRQK